MTTKTGVRGAAVSALAFAAVFTLSACSGGGDASGEGAQAEGVGDNSEAQGVYIGGTGNTESKIVSIHDDEVVRASIDHNGTCEDFTTLFDNAESGEFSEEYEVGTLNDSQSLIMWPSDTGEDPTPITVNTPDTGMITVGNDGDYFLPLTSDQGDEAFNQWKTTLCG